MGINAHLGYKDGYTMRKWILFDFVVLVVALILSYVPGRPALSINFSRVAWGVPIDLIAWLALAFGIVGTIVSLLRHGRPGRPTKSTSD
jgi:uncharacterized membrane protein